MSGPRFTEFDDFFDQKRAMLDALEPQLKSLNAALASAAKARSATAGSSNELAAAVQALLAVGGTVLRKPGVDALNALVNLKRRLADLAEEQARAEESEGGLFTCVDAYLRLCSSYRVRV